MNNEQPKYSADHTNDQATQEIKEPCARPQPQTRREAQILERLSSERGFAFDVYLERVWNGQEKIEDMEDDFDSLYQGSFVTTNDFVDEFMDTLGWFEAIHETEQAWGIPPKILMLNRSAFLEHIRNDFEFYVRGGEVHVFFA